MITDNERAELIYGVVDNMAEKLGVEDYVRKAVWDQVTPISQITLRFEESLRRNIPVSRQEADEEVQEVQDVSEDAGYDSLQ